MSPRHCRKLGRNIEHPVAVAVDSPGCGVVAVMVTVVLYQAFWSTLVAQSSCGHWSGTKRRALVVVESAHRGQSALISNQHHPITSEKESTSSKQHHPRMVVNNVAFRLVVDMVSYDPDQHMLSLIHI